jgi:hypothetical protein
MFFFFPLNNNQSDESVDSSNRRHAANTEEAIWVWISAMREMSNPSAKKDLDPKTIANTPTT